MKKNIRKLNKSRADAIASLFNDIRCARIMLDSWEREHEKGNIEYFNYYWRKISLAEVELADIHGIELSTISLSREWLEKNN